MANQYTYWVEFIDYDGAQRHMYLRGESVQQVRAVMDDYDIVVIDNTEIAEQPCWGSQA